MKTPVQIIIDLINEKRNHTRYQSEEYNVLDDLIPEVETLRDTVEKEDRIKHIKIGVQEALDVFYSGGVILDLNVFATQLYNEKYGE